ncbi:hypothetical protein DINM_000419 [Dirofilaria immitis]|nr:hypothetical protein [Dirofilaria immitis]
MILGGNGRNNLVPCVPMKNALCSVRCSEINDLGVIELQLTPISYSNYHINPSHVHGPMNMSNDQKITGTYTGGRATAQLNNYTISVIHLIIWQQFTALIAFSLY